MTDSKRHLQFVDDLIEPLRVTPGRKIRLQRDFEPSYTNTLSGKSDARGRLADGIAALADLQARLSAQMTFGVLLVLQGLDAAGKDSTIKHVMSGVNPQGVEVRSFKQPSAEELTHDFLWRYQRHLPERGRIGIFNRSHYEEVLVVRVHPEFLGAQRLPPTATDGDVWRHRYRQINDWEHYLVDNGIRVVKLLLNLSKDEQARRFIRRIDDPQRNWKLSVEDLRERQFWDDYQFAFDETISHTSTKWAPWYVVPADHKWFAHLVAAAVLVRTLTDIKPEYPKPPPELREQLAEIRTELLAEVQG